MKLRIGDTVEHTVSEGDGPVNALDGALRKALEPHFPRLKEMDLVDYKVRVINAREGTAARVRVVIESKDDDAVWGTVGVSENVIEASWLALSDAFDHKLAKDARRGRWRAGVRPEQLASDHELDSGVSGRSIRRNRSMSGVETCLAGPSSASRPEARVDGELAPSPKLRSESVRWRSSLGEFTTTVEPLERSKPRSRHSLPGTS